MAALTQSPLAQSMGAAAVHTLFGSTGGAGQLVDDKAQKPSRQRYGRLPGHVLVVSEPDRHGLMGEPGAYDAQRPSKQRISPALQPLAPGHRPSG